MCRDILVLKRSKFVFCYCNGYGDFIVSDYPRRRRANARSRDKAKEHRYVRRILKHRICKEM